MSTRHRSAKTYRALTKGCAVASSVSLRHCTDRCRSRLRLSNAGKNHIAASCQARCSPAGRSTAGHVRSTARARHLPRPAATFRPQSAVRPAQRGFFGPVRYARDVGHSIGTLASSGFSPHCPLWNRRISDGRAKFIRMTQPAEPPFALGPETRTHRAAVLRRPSRLAGRIPLACRHRAERTSSRAGRAAPLVAVPTLAGNDPSLHSPQFRRHTERTAVDAHS